LLDQGNVLEIMFAWVLGNWFTVLGWAIALIAFVVVPFRRSAAEARSWLLIFLAVPWVAVVIYWLIGRPHYSAERKARFDKIPSLIEKASDLSTLNLNQLAPRLGEDNTAIANLVRGIGPFSPVDGNKTETLSDYNATYDRIVADIDSASDHVHLEFYMFSNDSVGDRIMSALERARTRGVACRILIDALGSFGSISKIKRRMRRAGVEVCDLLPVHRRWNNSRLDLRNHRKIVVIDGHVGYTGSQNIWEPSDHSCRRNQDLMVRLTGPVVAQLQALFVVDWYLETQEELLGHGLFPPLSLAGGDPAQILASGPDFPHGGVDLVFVQAMYNASREIVIVTPYFIPNDALLAAMKSAVIAGVRVRFITPRKSDHVMVGLAQRSYYAELLSVGVEIYQYGPEFLHAKHFRVDREIAVIGSSNMDLRSFELNAEVDFVCYSATTAAQLETLEEQYLMKSIKLNAEEWEARPLALKVLENSARLVSDLI